jgi:SAM-dependent methyltransferase
MDATPRRLTFGAHAAAYERARPDWPADAARWFVPDDARFVVEVGAGTGKLTRALAPLGARVVAVEPDPRMLAVLRESGLDGVPGSAEEIPFPDGEADAVVAGSCIHWFDLERALPEIHRVLRPGGRFAFGWNHRDAREPGIAQMQKLIYDARDVGTSWRSRDWPAEVTGAGLFRDGEHELFAHVLELPREALEDHLLSYATVASLPEDEFRQVFTAVAGIVDSDPSLCSSGRLTLPFVVDAYRFARN